MFANVCGFFPPIQSKWLHDFGGWKPQKCHVRGTAVDGSEIRLTNWGCINPCNGILSISTDAGFLPSTVVSFSMESCSVSKLEGVTVHRALKATSFHEVYPHLCGYAVMYLSHCISLINIHSWDGQKMSTKFPHERPHFGDNEYGKWQIFTSWIGNTTSSCIAGARQQKFGICSVVSYPEFVI